VTAGLPLPREGWFHRHGDGTAVIPSSFPSLRALRGPCLSGFSWPKTSREADQPAAANGRRWPGPLSTGVHRARDDGSAQSTCVHTYVVTLAITMHAQAQKKLHAGADEENAFSSREPHPSSRVKQLNSAQYTYLHKPFADAHLFHHAPPSPANSQFSQKVANGAG